MLSLESIYAWFAKVLFQLLVSAIIRWMVRRVGAERFHERVLHWLEYWKVRPPRNALTEREVRDLGILRSVDLQVITQRCKEEIVRILGHWGLITRQWDVTLKTPLTFKCQDFFLASRSLLSGEVARSLGDVLQGESIVCFVILPASPDKRARVTVALENALESCLGSRPVFREFLVPAMLNGEIGAPVVSRVRQGEKILVLRPVAINDDYLARAVAYIRAHSMGEIAGIVTIVDVSGRGDEQRSANPPERVLVEMSLSLQGAEEVRQ